MHVLGQEGLVATRHGIVKLVSTASRGNRESTQTNCQMIREQNKLKQLEWPQGCMEEVEMGFFYSETSVKLETHQQFSCRKCGNKLSLGE